MSEPTINAQLAVQLLKSGVEVLELGVDLETWPDMQPGGLVRRLRTGFVTFTIKIYDPSRDEVK